MCADCLAAEEQKREGFRKRKEEADAKLTQELEDAEAIRA